MKIRRRERSRSWLAQAQSDLRTAKAVAASPTPMDARDVGCHVAALCAQAIEKSIKGYFVLCGNTTSNTHCVDKFVTTLIRTKCGRLQNQFRKISALFDPATKATVRELVQLTPGTLGRNDVPTTEYPWDSGSGAMASPVGNALFSNFESQKRWLGNAERVVNSLEKLRIAESRVP